jgi:hypothetical protein
MTAFGTRGEVEVARRVPTMLMVAARRRAEGEEEEEAEEDMDEAAPKVEAACCWTAGVCGGGSPRGRWPPEPPLLPVPEKLPPLWCSAAMKEPCRGEGMGDCEPERGKRCPGAAAGAAAAAEAESGCCLPCADGGGKGMGIGTTSVVGVCDGGHGPSTSLGSHSSSRYARQSGAPAAGGARSSRTVVVAVADVVEAVEERVVESSDVAAGGVSGGPERDGGSCALAPAANGPRTTGPGGVGVGSSRRCEETEGRGVWVRERPGRHSELSRRRPSRDAPAQRPPPDWTHPAMIGCCPSRKHVATCP